LLTDGSLCVDGWLVERDGVPGQVAGRIVQGARVGPWSPLLRKDRPDVAEHVLGTAPATTAFGVVGYIPGPVEVGEQVFVELRASGGGSVRAPVSDLKVGAVPEDVFAGLVANAPFTPQSLAAVVDVVRASPAGAPAGATVAYRHVSFAGTARVGVVVPVYENFTYVRNLLRAFAAESRGVELTFVCDDPALSEDLLAWLRGWNDTVFDVPIQLLAHDRNAGFAAACNAGWRSISSGVVLLLNSDVLVRRPGPDIALLANGLTADVAVVAPVLLFPDGTLQHAGMEMVDPTDFPGFVLPSHPGKHGPADVLPTAPFDVPMLTGAAMCLRRADLDAVGGVPSVFGRGDFEDVLLSVSLRDRGRLVVDPRVRWTHVEGASYRRDIVGGVAVTLAKSVVAGERVAAGTPWSGR
jgi:GT2 family glycosyltransferase